ncbi:acetyl-CoA synthetase-like protein [Fistulina hepatica ATCC 64428]|nr:acetyl-CoA synthetase-like protein [Fistulina hepatica ATCC 64428]
MTVSDISAPFPDPIPYDRQAVEIPGTRKPGQTGHYRNSIWGLVNSKDPRVCSTLDLVFERALKHCRNSRCLGYRPRISKNPLLFADHYVWQTFAEVDARRKAIGSALLPMFLNGECGAGEALKTVGLWSVNRPEWQIIDFAAHAYQLCIVTLYDTLGPDSVGDIQHSHLSIICCSSDHIPTLLQLAPKVPVLKVIVSLDDLDPDICTMTAAWAESVGVRVITLNEVETIGREKPLPPIRAKAEDIASICYTSGTTGNPKGALLSHRALAISSCVGNWGLVLPKEGTNLSYLPLAHIYGRILDLNVIAVGAAVGYFSGDNLRILEDAQILKPDLFASVPRVLNRLYQAIMAAGDAPGFKGALFRKAMQAKLEKWKATGDNTHAFWDRLVFRKVRMVLGGNVKTILSGSAPVSADVMHFLNIAFSCDCEEGKYGLTETCASFSKLWPLDVKGVGTVGPPSPYNEVKLVDVPEMNYTAEDKPFPRGEICIRGDNCFTGYYKNEEATKKAIDADGWFHTGDVGLIDSAGRVKIIDRVKNIMKLAQGEYVALEKIENMYSTCPVVQQIYVHGDSLQSFLVGVVVPDPVQLASMASTMTGKPVRAEDVTALAEACFNEGVIQGVFDALSREAKRNGLKGFECVKRIHLTMDPFTVEDNTLTPTLKLRRRDAHNKFKTEIERMYQLGESSTPPSLAKL